MVTAQELIAEAERRGARFRIEPGDALRAVPKKVFDLDPELNRAIGAHKAEVLAELRRRQEAVCATKWTNHGMVCAVCGRLGIVRVDDRVCQRCAGAVVDPPRPDPAKKPPCSSFRGHPTQAHLPCQTCGHGWLAHHPELVASAIVAARAAEEQAR
jgi:hypothetical protein